MNECPKISIIVPVYNTEKYLRRCVDSILAQTFTDFELLLIDDGSTDRSGAICDEYAQADSRVRVFHKENGGVSSARNFGIDNARCEWISFVDSDDWISKSCLDELFYHSNDTDCVICGARFINRGFVSKPMSTGYLEKEYLDEMMTNFFFLIPTTKLYRKEIISKKFDNLMRLSEDIHFNINYIIECRSIFLVDKVLYNYNDNDNISFRYKANLDEVCYNLRNLENSLMDLEKRRQVKLPVFLKFIMNLEISQFYYNLIHCDYNSFCNELKAFRIAKMQYFFDSKKKKIFVFFLKKCPLIAFLICKIIRMRYGNTNSTGI